MGYKSVYEKIREAQAAGTFEGMMKAQGKDIRFFGDEYFASKSVQEIASELNNDEYDYYKAKIHAVIQREGNEYYEAKQREINEWKNFVEGKKQWAVDEVMRKVKHLPAPIRPAKERIEQDVKNIVGNPLRGADDFVGRLSDYVGVASTGEIPAVVIGEGKGGENPATGQ